MEILIWIGTCISLTGLVGIIWCIIKVNKARRDNLPDDQMRDVVKNIIPYNLGAFFMSIIGLMLVILGISFS